MPFQDIDETEAPPMPRVPNAAERWARRVFLEDWGLKLLAMAITIVLWFGVTGQNKPVTQRVSGVQLNFLRPDGLEISNELPSTLEVILTGSPSRLDEITPRSLVATVDVSDQKAGERVVRLSPGRVKMELPEGVKVEGFRPATLPVRLESIVEGLVDVEVKLEGKLPAGYVVSGVTPTPAKVRLRGPSDRINAIKTALTETVWLDGRTESFTLSRVAINVPDPKIDVVDSNVDIRVDIAPKKPADVQMSSSAADMSLLAQFFGLFLQR